MNYVEKTRKLLNEMSVETAMREVHNKIPSTVPDWVRKDPKKLEKMLRAIAFSKARNEETEDTFEDDGIELIDEAKLNAHGSTELARFVRRERREDPEMKGEWIHHFSFRSNGKVLKKTQFKHDDPPQYGKAVIDHGWKRWKSVKKDQNPHDVIKKWKESGKYEHQGPFYDPKHPISTGMFKESAFPAEPGVDPEVMDQLTGPPARKRFKEMFMPWFHKGKKSDVGIDK